MLHTELYIKRELKKNYIIFFLIKKINNNIFIYNFLIFLFIILIHFSLNMNFNRDGGRGRRGFFDFAGGGFFREPEMFILRPIRLQKKRELNHTTNVVLHNKQTNKIFNVSDADIKFLKISDGIRDCVLSLDLDNSDSDSENVVFVPEWCYNLYKDSVNADQISISLSNNIPFVNLITLLPLNCDRNENEIVTILQKQLRGSYKVVNKDTILSVGFGNETYQFHVKKMMDARGEVINHGRLVDSRGNSDIHIEILYNKLKYVPEDSDSDAENTGKGARLRHSTYELRKRIVNGRASDGVAAMLSVSKGHKTRLPHSSSSNSLKKSESK